MEGAVTQPGGQVQHPLRLVTTYGTQAPWPSERVDVEQVSDGNGVDGQDLRLVSVVLRREPWRAEEVRRVGNEVERSLRNNHLFNEVHEQGYM